MISGKVRSVASYRASFAFELFSNLASTILDLLTVFVLFRAAATVGHFALTEAVLMTGLAMSGFVLCDAVVGNIDALGFGFVAYQPALALMGRTDPLGLPVWAGYAAPLVCLPATLVAALVWRSGVRHYRSTGS
jgi:ABC-type uncharacterized transport system permease subunit